MKDMVLAAVKNAVADRLRRAMFLELTEMGFSISYAEYQANWLLGSLLKEEGLDFIAKDMIENM